MPIYEFECTTCSTRFDRLLKLSDPNPAECPECGNSTIKRCLTAPSFRLSGSGWYETDFKKDTDKKRNLVDKGEPARTEAKPADGAKATESKPAEKKPAEKTPAEKKPAEKTPAEKTPAAKPESKPVPAASS